MTYVPTRSDEPSDGVDRVGPWTVQYDAPRACGNRIMGMGRCTGYFVNTNNAHLSLQTIGLSRSESDRVALSFVLDD